MALMDNNFSKFNSQTYGSLDFAQMTEKLLSYVSDEPNVEYEIIIGTDSLFHSGSKADFVSAIIVHRKRSGGIYFWTKRQEAHMHSLRQRIFQEALDSLKLAGLLINKLKEMNIQDFNLSIHVDVGPNGETKTMVKEIVGMITGSGFRVKTKPDSYAASSVADRHT